MKKFFYTLFLLSLVAVQNIVAQEATAIKNSFIIPNGAWYAGSGTGVTVFNGMDLGKLTTLTLNGQIASVGESDPKNLPVIMHYKIDDYYEHTIELQWYEMKNGENRFGTPDGSGSVDVDLSYVKGGEHKLAVWFSKESSSEAAIEGQVYDSNNGANYVANFSTETNKYSVKNNWDAGSDNWTWKQMTKEDDVFVLDNVVFGGTGVNVSETADDFDNIWISAEEFLGDKIKAGDVVKLVFSPDEETITATLKTPASADDTKVRKKPKCVRVLENGEWLIICGKEVYNLLGSHIRTISK